MSRSKEDNMKKIVFMDGFDEVRDAETQSKVIFSTVGIAHMVVDDVVNLWNKAKSYEECFGAEGSIDSYLLHSRFCEQEDREEILEGLFDLAFL